MDAQPRHDAPLQGIPWAQLFLALGALSSETGAACIVSSHEHVEGHRAVAVQQVGGPGCKRTTIVCFVCPSHWGSGAVYTGSFFAWWVPALLPRP